MKDKVFSQEGLKLLACITMLLDHIAAVFRWHFGWRIVGRLAFPIYCFLLAEGVVYTKNPKRYALRLCIGVLLAEIPFDLALFGGLTLRHQSVMVTLLLGFLALEVLKRMGDSPWRVAAMLPFVAAGDLLHTDYGTYGVLLVVMFGMTRQLPKSKLWQLAGLTLICASMNSVRVPVFGVRIPIELFAVPAWIPMALYSGRKISRSKSVQWLFYLFYPAHLTILALLDRML